MATYYVDPVNGNDADDGLSWANAFLTFNGAENEPVAAGDIVYVGPGVYREILTVDVSGGNAYLVGTVDVTNGSKQVDGNGTLWVANVAADYMFHIAIYASGNDGVANGTATFTSAGGNFQAAMVGQVIQINTRNSYKIGAVAAANSITLVDVSGVGWPAAAANLVYSVMSGQGPYDIDSVDDNTTIQLKQAWSGRTLTAIAYITYNPIRYIGDVTGEHTDGVGGIIRVTGSNNDTTQTRGHGIFAVDKSYRIFRGFFFDMNSTANVENRGGGTHWTLEDCVFWGQDGVTLKGVDPNYPDNCTVRRCLFLCDNNEGCILVTADANHSSSGILIENCMLLAAYYTVMIDDIAGVTIRNCFVAFGAGHGVRVLSLGVGESITAENCIFRSCDKGVSTDVLGSIVEDYNTFWYNQTDRVTVAVGGNSVAYPPLFVPPILHAGASQASGFKFPWWLGQLSEWSPVRAITGSNEPGVDLHGVARPVTAAKNSWGPLQFADMERETGTVRTGSASLVLHDAGRHQIWIPVTNTSTTFSIHVYREANYAGNNPQMIIKQPGQADDVTTDAAAAGQWNPLTTTLTPAADPPYVIVELVSRNTNGANDEVFFDDLKVS